MFEKRYKVHRVLFALLVLFLVIASSTATINAEETEVELPEGTPTPWMMEYEPPFIWFAGDYNDKGYVAVIDTRTVRSDPNGSLKTVQVAPPFNPEGDSYMLTVGVDHGGGFVWASTMYSGPDDGSSDLITRINPTTKAVHNYWLMDVRFSMDLEVCVERGTILLAASHWNGADLEGAIIEFDPVGDSIVNVWYTLGTPYDLLLDGECVWFTATDLGRFNLTDESFTYYDTATSPVFLAKSPEKGRVYFTENNYQSVGYVDDEGEVVERRISGWVDAGVDGPYGLACYNQYLIVAGYGAQQVKVFNVNTENIVATYNYTSRPYCPVLGVDLSDLWCWGQGSVHMIYIDASGLIPDPEPPSRGVRGAVHYTQSFIEDGSFAGDYVIVCVNMRGLEKGGSYVLSILSEGGEVLYTTHSRFPRKWKWIMFYFGESLFPRGNNTILLTGSDWSMSGHYAK